MTVTLEQRGVEAKPLRAVSDCFGTFITYFKIPLVRSSGKVTVRVDGLNGAPDAVGSAAMDPFYRRSDIAIHYEGQWPTVCPQQTDLWEQRVTMTGRLVNRTAPYEQDGVTYHAVPQVGRVRLAYYPHPNSTGLCAVVAGTCREIEVDERGDFRYSWVFAQDVNATGVIEVEAGGQRWNFSVDPDFRQAIGYIETSGQGPPEIRDNESPAPGGVALVVAVALALAGRSLLVRTRRDR